MEHNFGPASACEQTVFGASRPGYPDKEVASATVQEWIRFVQDRDIERVVCLLPDSQLECYRQDLIEEYRGVFGPDCVLLAPIDDFRLPSPENLGRILEFLKEGDDRGQRVVVHCAGGMGRTGQVLAAWLVHARGLAPGDAIETVERAEPRRYPMEALRSGNATGEQLLALLRDFSPASD